MFLLPTSKTEGEHEYADHDIIPHYTVVRNYRPVRPMSVWLLVAKDEEQDGNQHQNSNGKYYDD